MSRRTHCWGSIGVAGAAAMVLALGSFSAAQNAWAEDAESLAVDVRDCVQLETPEERFACYENRVGEALQERSAGAPAGDGPAARTSVPAASVDEAARPAETSEPIGDEAVGGEGAVEASGPARGQPNVDSFGLRQPREREAAEAEELYGTVAAIRETVPNSYLITLENGQVWRQMRPQRYPLRAGHEVRIYPTNWGSAYRLSAAELGGFIQVERVR